MAEQNSFTGMQDDVVNEDIHSLIAETMNFRVQLITRPELKAQGGWNNDLNNFMKKRLEKITKQLALSTVKVDSRTQEELEEEAAGNNNTLADSYSTSEDVAYAQDNILGSSQNPIPVVYNFTGTDPDVPQVTKVMVPNTKARGFIKKLDFMVVELTNLDSRHSPFGIEKFDSLKIRGQYLSKLYTVCQEFGGEANRDDIPTGVLPSNEPKGFNFNGEFDPKTE